MADAIDILTLAEAKTALNIGSSVNTYDTELASYITAVTRAVDNIAGPVVARTNTSELYDGGCWSFRPRTTPVLSVVSLTEYSGTTSTALTAESNSTKPGTGYLLDSDGKHNVTIRRRANNGDAQFPSGRRNLELTYRPGRYADTASVVPLFKQAAAIVLGALWRGEQGSGNVTFGAVLTAGGMEIPAFAIPNAARHLLSAELLPVQVR